MGGIAATNKHVIFGGRDIIDGGDSFTCLNAETGEVQWQIIYPAPGRLDYGNSPRGTPLIHEGHAFLQGAFGQLTCVNIETGETVWQKNLAIEFAVELPTWGFCGSPIVVNNRLLIQTASYDASLLALDPKSGEVLWQTAGSGTGYSSLVAGKIGETLTIVGYQEETVAGWDASNGKLLWEIKPKHSGDFNVPTPIVGQKNLWLISENNGLRRYPYENGKPKLAPEKQNERLTPDSHSPTKVDDRIFVMYDGLHCIDAETLTKKWSSDDFAFNVYGSIIATDNRILVTTFNGDVILADAKADEYKALGRWKLVDDGTELYAHPAIAGTKMFVRVGKQIRCIELNSQQ